MISLITPDAYSVATIQNQLSMYDDLVQSVVIVEISTLRKNGACSPRSRRNPD
jgi:hypothetical protein